MSLIARIRGLFRRKEVKVISLTWSKPFYLFGGHRIFEMDPLGNIAHLPFDSDRVQHRGNSHYCIRMKKGYSYTTALNESNARRQFAKRGFDLLKNAATR